ncbi:hypothetical protein [uncultured Cetobacterium sp.]|uniref:hypothetical protein n=1 Tax=uncultured Cetobacterium sp. TaxID=527638 RepID=UPI0026053FE7|nr:hypothetical protein [uncultured Cetobacterium sp.]
MSKKLKSFHKLFFIIIFSIIFSGVIGSGSSPDLPEKIAPELEQIEALPRRTKPAELDIEVTKIKSEPLEDVYIDRKNKNIYVDFSKKREQTLRGVKDAEELEKKYNLVVSETVQGTNEVNGRKKSSRNTSSVMDYEVVEYQGKKVLKIPYENEPEKFYISIQESGNGKVVKVYGVDAKSARSVEKQVTERKEVTVFYKNGYNTGWVGLNRNGIVGPNMELIKENFISGNIMGFDYGCTPNKHNHNIKISIENEPNYSITNHTPGDRYSDRTISIGVMKIFLRIFCDGSNIDFQITQLPTIKKTYKIKIIHTNIGGEIKEHTLNLTEGYLENLMTIRNSLRDIVIQDTENIVQDIYSFGNVSLEQTNPEVLYDQAFPIIGLGPELEINRDGWRAETSNTNEKRTIPITDTFKNVDSMLEANLYFLNINSNGGQLLERSTQEINKEITAIGSYKPNTRERIGGELVVKINLNELKSILNNFRNNSSSEIVLSSSKPIGEQLTFAGGQYKYSYKDGKYLYYYLVDDVKKYKKSIKYPDIKIVKPQISDTSKLEINKTFNTNNYIIFKANGINTEAGVTCPIPGERSLKSLHFNGTYTLNEGNKIDIDATGNSVINTINIFNGLNTLNLEIKYEGRYPKIKILNKPMAGTYKLNIKHYESSGLKRLDYNLDIVIKEDFAKERSVTVTYLKGYDRLMLDKQGFEKINFDILGKPNVNTSTNEYIKVDTNGEFISGLIGDSIIKIKNINGELIKEVSGTEKEIDLGELKLFFSSQGFFSLQMKTVENQKIFEYIIEHYSKNELKLRDKLNIKAIQEKVNDREVTLSYIDGYDHYFVRKVDIDSQGQITPGIPVELIRDNFPSGFITGLNTSPSNDYDIKIKIIRLNLDGTDYTPKEEKIGGVEEILIMNDFDLIVGKNGMSIIVKNLNNSNSYKYRVEQYIEVGGIRVLKNKDILNIKNKNITREFEVKYNIKDIIIIPSLDGDPNKTKIEYPDNWVKIIQLTDDKNKFPVIGINQVLGDTQNNSWSLETQTPLNPINHKPYVSLDLTSSNSSNIKVPINIRETPFQKAEKFLVYDRGDMTNRNTAVGAYTPLKSFNISPLNNEVQIDFEMIFENIPTSQMEIILKYAKEKFEQGQNKVEIPYSKSINNHKILAIRGLQESVGSNQTKYKINSNNILSYGVVDFPKIYVVKDGDMIDSNVALLNFINPVPKSNKDISGTFDIKNGIIEPNNLPEYNHPSSLTVSGLTSSWHGVTNVPEYHKIKIYSGTDIGIGITPKAEFMTTESGEIKGVHTIATKNNKYILMKGKNTPLAIGILEWDFTKIVEDTITLVHYNNVGRIIAKDIYKINIEEFLPKKYLDVVNSTLINKIDINKTLKVTADARQDFIEFGSLKLENYQKDITKTVEDTKGIKIEALSNEITLLSTSGNILLKGNLKFDNGNKEILNPNESANLRFVLSQESIDNIENLVGKTFSLMTPLELIKISGGKKNEILLNNLIITLSNAQSGNLSSMTYISTVTNLKIKDIDNIIATNKTKFDLDGQMTLRQINSGQGNSVPAIAIGNDAVWKFGVDGITKRDRSNSKTNRRELKVQYEIVGSNPVKKIEVFPELTKSKTKATQDNSNYNRPIKLYTEKNLDDKVLTAVSYAEYRDTMSERITTGLTLNIPIEQLKEIKNELKNIKGDVIELKAVGENAKIAYIHGRDAGGSGISTNGNTLSLPTDTNISSKYVTELLPSIFIDKEKLNKNLEINLLPTYPLKEEQEKIIFKSMESPFYSAGKVIINPTNDNRVMEGLNYQHKIKLTLPGGEIKEYNTLLDGAIIIKEVIEKNGKSITLNVDYKSGNEAHIWITNRNGAQYYDLVLQHIDPSGDVRRTINLRINSGLEGSTSAKQGEMDLTISSRYNPIDGQLNSEPILITKDGVKYQTEVLDLKLLNGDYPIELKENQKAYINEEEIFLNESYTTVTLNKGTIIKAKQESNGDLKIKPIYWNYNTEDEFILEYKKESIVTNQYKFNVKCPEFFVASSGVLDFGKLYQFGNPQDKIVTTNIELNYNTNVNAEYSLDISQGELAIGTDIFKNYLYLDDNKTLLVKDLFLGEEVGKETTKRTLPLTGTIHGPSILKASEGKYEKTIQILIHLK